MTFVQPDLFGDDTQHAPSRDQPATCPCCGITEPNQHLLHQNHGQSPPRRSGLCVAQELVSGHIRHAIVYGWDHLPRSLARGRQLGLDVDAIAAQARDELAQRTGGEDRA